MNNYTAIPSQKDINSFYEVSIVDTSDNFIDELLFNFNIDFLIPSDTLIKSIELNDKQNYRKLVNSRYSNILNSLTDITLESIKSLAVEDISFKNQNLLSLTIYQRLRDKNIEELRIKHSFDIAMNISDKINLLLNKINEESITSIKKEKIKIFITELSKNKRLKNGSLKNISTINNIINNAFNKVIETNHSISSDKWIALFEKPIVESFIKDYSKSEKKINKKFNKYVLEEVVKGSNKIILCALSNIIFNLIKGNKNNNIKVIGNEIEVKKDYFLELIGKKKNKSNYLQTKEDIIQLSSNTIKNVIVNDDNTENIEFIENLFSFKEIKGLKGKSILWRFKNISDNIFSKNTNSNVYYLSFVPILEVQNYITRKGKRQDALIDFIFSIMLKCKFTSYRKNSGVPTELLNYGSNSSKEFNENVKIIKSILQENYNIEITRENYNISEIQKNKKIQSGS